MRNGAILGGLLLFLAGTAAGVVLTGHLRTQAESGAAPVAATAAAIGAAARAPVEPPRAAASRGARGSLPDFAGVAESSIPAVANISSRQVVRQRSPFSNDAFFRYFFGDSGGFSGYRERPSLGSGVIVDPDGRILTNAHVVGRQTAGITVTLPDNREFEATLVGRDEMTDIALLQIEAAGLPTLPWGDSAERCESRSGCWPSATHSSSTRPSRWASSAPSAATTSASRATRTSSRPTPQSTRVTPAAR